MRFFYVLTIQKTSVISGIIHKMQLSQYFIWFFLFLQNIILKLCLNFK